MEDYSQIFNDHWRGKDLASPLHVSIIQNSCAKSFRELCGECENLKKQELARGDKFYEPSTYYKSYEPADYHTNVEWAARRLATDVFSSFSRYVGHKCKDIRPLPEEMSEYDLKLWLIRHPEPLAEPVLELWDVTNRVTPIEPWAWPMMIGLDKEQYMPNKMDKGVFKMIMDRFMEIGYTEDDFFKAHSDLWKLFEWVSGKGL
jgi:hypothetical protein